MTEFERIDERRSDAEGLNLGKMAREEFWIVTKAYFAPIYAIVLAGRKLADWRKSRNADTEPWLTPAE